MTHIQLACIEYTRTVARKKREADLEARHKENQERDKRKLETYARSRAKGVHPGQQKRVNMSKQRSLQPRSTPLRRKGTIATQDPFAPPKKALRPDEREHKPITDPLTHPFEHKFFGRSLAVGNYTICDGLDNSVHRLEIVQNQMYVDNKPYRANVGDLERIKTLIRGAQI